MSTLRTVQVSLAGSPWAGRGGSLTVPARGASLIVVGPGGPAGRAPAGLAAQQRHPLLGGPMLARDETLTFILVNVLDYFMTYVILYYSHMQEGSPLRLRMMESNPVAAYFINHWGLIKGMLGFKLGLVILICIVTQAIAFKNEQTAARVLNLGSLLTGCVVIYSLWLLVRAMG